MAMTVYHDKNNFDSTAAAIDIGSNAIRMIIGQLGPDGNIQVLENLHKTVLLGHDTFSSGRIGRKVMQNAIGILREFSNVLKAYKVSCCRVVATSAVREASNADVFLDRVMIATGVEVEIIDTSEESRLMVTAIYNKIDRNDKLLKGNVLVVEAGGGSTLLTLVHDGDIIASHSIGLGAVKLLEEYYNWQSAWTEVYQQAIYRLNSFVDTTRSLISLNKVDKLILLGSDIRFVAYRAGEPEVDNVIKLPSETFQKYVKRMQKLSPSELAMKYNDITLSTAETLNPAFAIYQALLKMTEVNKIYVPLVNMREGILADIFHTSAGTNQDFTWREAIHSAHALAEKYQIFPEEYETIVHWCKRLFEDLSSLHNLKSRFSVLLEIAAILHRVGTFISTRAYHKHTFYIISSSEIFGLDNADLNLVAQVARYHRRSFPKNTHSDYISLPREQRMNINKMAAILRVAISLSSVVGIDDDIKFNLNNDVMLIESGSDSINGRMRQIQRAVKILEDIFCISVVTDENE